MKAQKKRGYIRNRHLKLLIVLSLLILTTVAAVVVSGIFIFNRTTRDYRERILLSSSKLAAGQIDGDKVDGWFKNEPDSEYESTSERLESIIDNTPFIQYLYVYQIRPDGCHVVFDFDTTDDELAQYDELPEVSSGNFGEVIAFDDSFSEYIPTLLEGGRIGVIESNDTYGWLLTQYEPVYDSLDKCVAYVGVDISMIGVFDYVKRYIFFIVIIAVIFFAGCIIIGARLYIDARRADELDNVVDRQKRDKRLLREIIEAFAKVVDLKDSYTQGHSARVARYTEMLARELGCDDETVEKYYNIALMHDIGKIGVPDSVLNKPGKLTDEEFELIRSHTTRGYEVLKNISLMPEIAVGAYAHHERPDGKGYPRGPSGDEIPRVAQIIAVADCFDAMYSNRPYRSRMNFDKAVSIIRGAAGTQLTADAVDAFLRLVEKGEFRAPDDDGGGSTESTENIHAAKGES